MVKALDSKSNGIFQRSFEPCSQRIDIFAPTSVFFCSDTKSQRNGQKASENQIWTNKIATAVMAEWLRRWTRNPMGSSRTGSNPVHSALTFLHLKVFLCSDTKSQRNGQKVSQNQIWTNKIATAVMAEWLRRWTRNPMGSSRTGSNPVHSALTFLHLKRFYFFTSHNLVWFVCSFVKQLDSFAVTQNHKEMDKKLVKTRSEPT